MATGILTATLVLAPVVTAGAEALTVVPAPHLSLHDDVRGAAVSLADPSGLESAATTDGASSDDLPVRLGDDTGAHGAISVASAGTGGGEVVSEGPGVLVKEERGGTSFAGTRLDVGISAAWITMTLAMAGAGVFAVRRMRRGGPTR